MGTFVSWEMWGSGAVPWGQAVPVLSLTCLGTLLLGGWTGRRQMEINLQSLWCLGCSSCGAGQRGSCSKEFLGSFQGSRQEDSSILPPRKWGLIWSNSPICLLLWSSSLRSSETSVNFELISSAVWKQSLVYQVYGYMKDPRDLQSISLPLN